ncbi:MAG TPA: radical SAM protein [Fibrobacteria bacterium]|nr:radical SAM protein [Fibrobacteria bacterium]
MPTEDHELRREQSHHPREFTGHVYTYPVLSRRSGGLSIGVNLNLDKACTFDCPYCQVDRTVPKPAQPIDLTALREEVGRLLDSVDKDGVCRLERFAAIPDQDKRLRDIAVSGDGEPTMIPAFAEVCAALADLQTARSDLDFNLILITNSTLLDRPKVLAGIGSLLSRKGEVWAKLDAGTEAWYQRVNVSKVSLDRIEAGLVRLGSLHPYSIQTMWHGFDGGLPPDGEVDAWLARLRRIRDAGSRIREVQLYTLARQPSQAVCTPVPGPWLAAVRDRVASETGLRAVVYGVQD